jgi:hypothetical protein
VRPPWAPGSNRRQIRIKMNILNVKNDFQHCTVLNYWAKYTVVQNDCDCLKFHNFV